LIQVRFWLALFALWLLVLSNIDRIVSLNEITTASKIAAALFSAGIFLIGWPNRIPRAWLFAIAIGTAPAARLVMGMGLMGTDFAFVVVEACMIALTLGIANQILSSLAVLRQVAEEAVTIQLGAELITPGRGELGIQEEMTRARRFDRPLTVVTVSARGQRKQQELDAILLKAQREVIDRYVEGRLYRLLQQQVRECDIVTRQNGQFVLMMPEADREFAQTIIDRVQEVAADEIGLTVNAGIASFPSEERTLVGLMDRASAEMDSKLLSSAKRTAK
jgi:hypothetical protein